MLCCSKPGGRCLVQIGVMEVAQKLCADDLKLVQLLFAAKCSDMLLTNGTQSCVTNAWKNGSTAID